MPHWRIAVHRWIVKASKIPQDRVRWADDEAPWPSTKDGLWISLRVMADDGVAWTEYHVRPYSFPDLAVDSVNPASGELGVANLPLFTGDGPVRLAGAGIPSGLEASKDYWAIRASASSLRLASSLANAIDEIAVEVADTGSLPLSIVATDHTVRSGAEMDEVTKSSGPVEVSIQVRGVGAFERAKETKLRSQAPQTRALLHGANVGLLSAGAVQNVGAALNAGNYEQRAAMTVRLAVSSEHVDTVSAIESVDFEGTTS